MRGMRPGGVCACCGREGPVWVTDPRPFGDFEAGLIWEADTTLPPLCDGCDYAQRRWDARQHQIRNPGAGYPYFEPPPRTPPVRRGGDVDLGPDRRPG